MGYGDELMAMGQAERIWRETGERVSIVDIMDRPRWSSVWANHPAILRPGESCGDYSVLRDGPNCRAYIKNWTSWGGQPAIVWSGWRARDHRGHMALDAGEVSAGLAFKREMGGDYVVIEPCVSQISSQNKRWDWKRWKDLVWTMPGVRFVQLGAKGLPVLGGVRRVETDTFRGACAILARAVAYVGPEGGLHIAAASLGVPAAVIFGGYGNIEATGYPEHYNIAVPGPEHPCGRWAPCPFCKQALDSITVDRVGSALRAAMERVRTNG